MPRQSKTTFGNLVRQWRAARHLTRTAASKHLKIPLRTLEDWETGRRTPRGIARRILETKFSKVTKLLLMPAAVLWILV